MKSCRLLSLGQSSSIGREWISPFFRLCSLSFLTMAKEWSERKKKGAGGRKGEDLLRSRSKGSTDEKERGAVVENRMKFLGKGPPQPQPPPPRRRCRRRRWMWRRRSEKDHKFPADRRRRLLLGCRCGGTSDDGGERVIFMG
jgi:hypothetical protein